MSKVKRYWCVYNVKDGTLNHARFYNLSDALTEAESFASTFNGEIFRVFEFIGDCQARGLLWQRADDE